MSTDATEPPEAPVVDAQLHATGHVQCPTQIQPAFLHSPPDSNNAEKSEPSDSELSDLDDEPFLDDAPMLPPPPPPPPAAAKPEPNNDVNGERDDHVDLDKHHDHDADDTTDIGEILPDHWSGSVPVFRPTMDQFKDFKLFMQKVDSYGMKSGIIKIIPPAEWKNAQPPLDNLIKQVRVREPIKQDIMGSNGTYRQVNILHGRSYNVPQWRSLCEQSEHQPPARRGERRANADKSKQQRARLAALKSAPSAAPSAASPKSTRGGGRPSRTRGRNKKPEDDARPMTPDSPKVDVREARDEVMASVEDDTNNDVDGLDTQPTVRRMGGVRPAKPKTQSTSARRKYGRREGSAVIDEVAFKDFDYRMDTSDFTPERCEELERVYWKTLTYAPPLYGADLMGTLFDERTEIWNLNKLPNILDVLGTKVPGVNTAYLYLGMWKATFAWHLEDVDLYSINYLHFGAPKQWYSISQADARRFEAAMKSIWPADAKACDQFLRHKAFLISPQHLLSNFGIKVNKCVSYPGEFVVTYPYGYHSGYNLGYNCAEAVNFALESWLDMGKIAKKCECAQAQDSVWINVYEIERKLRGEDTEYEETEEEDEDENEDDYDDGGASGLPTPPASHGVKFKRAGRKRKRGLGDKGARAKMKKIKLRLKIKAEPPCCLCPNDIPGLELLPTNHGKRAHSLCALYIPETFIDVIDGKEVVCNVARVHKDRLELKCLFCRSKRGACFQCSQKKCARAYHATCAAAAGVFVEDENVPVFGEDGKEYKEQAFEFSCRFHRSKRDRKLDGNALEEDATILAAAQALKQGEVCQMQYFKGDIFAGIIVENRLEEQTLLIDVLPHGDRIEVEWKWLLLPSPSDFHLPKASANAIPLPTSQKAKDQLNAKRHHEDKPRKDDVFVDGCTWAEFNTLDVTNKDQAKVDFSKADQIWHYLGQTSTEAKAQFTEDPSKPRFNPKGNFLDTLPKPPKTVPASRSHYQHYQQYGTPGAHVYTHGGAKFAPQPPSSGTAPEKPYAYKPKHPEAVNFSTDSAVHTEQRFVPDYSVAGSQPQAFPPHHHVYSAVPLHQNAPSTIPSGALQVLHPPAPIVSAPSPTAGLPPNGFLPTGVPPNGALPNGLLAAGFPAAGPSVAGPSTAITPPPRPPAADAPQMPSAVPPSAMDRNPHTPSQSVQVHSKPTWQVHSSIFQKYPFYQINHNRDSSKYRTPYAPWGGFTNGYQGDLRAHLMENQQDLLRRSTSFGSSPSTAQATQTSVTPGLKKSSSSFAASTPSGSLPRSQPPIPRPAPSQPNSSVSPPFPAKTPDHQNYPAIKPQYRMLAQQSPPTQPAAPASKPKPTPALKSYKVGLPAAINLSLKSTKSATQVPMKQSPVPLPANFLAAMTSLPCTPASSSPPPLNLQATQTSSTKKSASPAQSSPVNLPSVNGSTGIPGSTCKPVRVSTTPVPLPTFSRALQQTSTPIQQVVEAKLDLKETKKSPRAAGIQLTDSAAPCVEIPRGTVLAEKEIAKLVGPEGVFISNTAFGTSNGRTLVDAIPQPSTEAAVTHQPPQEFPDVPGCESMEFVERMIGNLKRASQRRGVD